MFSFQSCGVVPYDENLCTCEKRCLLCDLYFKASSHILLLLTQSIFPCLIIGFIIFGSLSSNWKGGLFFRTQSSKQPSSVVHINIAIVSSVRNFSLLIVYGKINTHLNKVYKLRIIFHITYFCAFRFLFIFNFAVYRIQEKLFHDFFRSQSS